MENDYGIRTVDELGRVVIPTELRKKLSLEAGDTVKVTEQDGAVIFRLAEKAKS